MKQSWHRAGRRSVECAGLGPAVCAVRPLPVDSRAAKSEHGKPCFAHSANGVVIVNDSAFVAVVIAVLAFLAFVVWRMRPTRGRIEVPGVITGEVEGRPLGSDDRPLLHGGIGHGGIKAGNVRAGKGVKALAGAGRSIEMGDIEAREDVALQAEGPPDPKGG